MQNELVTSFLDAHGDDYVSYQRVCVSNESDFARTLPFLAILTAIWRCY